MKKTLLLIAVMATLLGCKKNSSDDNGGVFIVSLMYAKVLDVNGENLLDPKNPNYLSDIKMYQYIDNKATLVYDPDMTASRGYLLLKPETVPEYGIESKLFVEMRKDWSLCIHTSTSELKHNTAEWLYDESINVTYRTGMSRTIIQWTETDIDTIKVEYRDYFQSGSRDMLRVWVNEELKWDLYRDFKESPRFLYTKIMK